MGLGSSTCVVHIAKSVIRWLPFVDMFQGILTMVNDGIEGDSQPTAGINTTLGHAFNTAGKASIDDALDLIQPNNDIAGQLCLPGQPKMTRIGRTSVKYTNDEAGVGLVWRKHGELVNDYLFPLRTEVP